MEHLLYIKKDERNFVFMKKLILLIPLFALLVLGAIVSYKTLYVCIPTAILAFIVLVIIIVGIIFNIIDRKIEKEGFETTANIIYFKDVLASRREPFDVQTPLAHGAYSVYLSYKDEKGVEQKALTQKIYYGDDAINIKKLEEIKVRCKGNRVFIIN